MRRNRDSVVRSTKALLLSVAAVTAFAGRAEAQTWTGSTTGSWSVAANWAGGVPNTATATALVDNGNPQNTNVTVDGGFVVGTLVISSGDQVTIANSFTFNLANLLSNAGTVTLNSSGNNVILNPNGGSLLMNGGGTIVLNGGNSSLAFLGNNGTINNANNTVTGQGVVANNNCFFINGGTVNANVNGSAIFVDPAGAGMTNSGTLTSSNGATLRISGQFGGGLTNSGTISAQNNSVTQLESNMGVTGGTFATSGTGVVKTADGNSVNLDSINNLGNWTLGNNSISSYTGDLFNSGSINMAAGANNVQFNFNSGTTNLTGGGTINMNTPSGGNNFLHNGNGRLVNVNNTIRGTGVIANNNGFFTNEVGGLVSADVSGQAIFCDPRSSADSFINNGNMRAANGGILQLTGQFGGGVTNNGTISAQTGSEVQLFSSIGIVGGTLNSAGTGIIRVLDGHTAGVQSITLAGNVIVGNNSTLNLSPSTISNSGSININAAANNSVVALVAGGTVTLTGGGTVNMTSGTGTLAGVAFIAGSGTFVNQNTAIPGAGNLAANNIAFVNNGTVSADLSGQAIFVDPVNGGGTIDFTNNGTMQASNGGILQLSGQFGGRINNTTGRIIANNASNVQMFSANSVVGGTLSSAGSGTISVSAGHTAFITEVTNNGAMVVLNAADLQAGGAVTNNGSISLNPVASNARLLANGSTSLAGTGTVFLTDGGSTGRSGFVTTGGTIVIGASQTVRGVGDIAGNNGAILNNGTIVADQNAKTIFCDPVNAAGGFVNNNVMSATGGGILQFTGQFGGSVTNNGTISAGSASLIQYLTSNFVSGGTLTSSGTGANEVAAGHSAFFANNVNTGTINVQNNAAFNGSGTLVNNGTIALNPGASSARFQSNSGTYLVTGTGVILMNAGAGGPAEIGVPGNTIDFGASITVRGRGNIAGNNGAIVNRGVIAASGGGEIFVDPLNAAGGFQNLGTLRVENASQMRFNGQFGGGVTNSGHVDVQAGGTLVTENSHPMSGGTMTLNGVWTAATSSNTDLIRFRGSGTLNISNSARVGLLAGGGTNGTSRVTSLSIASNGRLDLNDHDLVIDYTGSSPIGTIRPLLQSGFGSGSWNGSTTMITTTAGATAAGTPDKTGIGYVEATDLGSPANFSGVPIDSTCVLLRYTLLGDSTMDYTVNISDFARLGANFNLASNWFNGDYNYDGTTNIGDFSLLASNFNKVYTPAADLPRGSAVPEPGSAMLIAMGTAMSLKRPRRR